MVVAVPEPGQTEGMLLLVVVGVGGVGLRRWVSTRRNKTALAREA